jgi:hypothetical protein
MTNPPKQRPLIINGLRKRILFIFNFFTASQSAEECQAALRRFFGWVQEKHPKVVEIGQVTRTLAREYLEAESARGATQRTCNGTMKL